MGSADDAGCEIIVPWTLNYIGIVHVAGEMLFLSEGEPVPVWEFRRSLGKPYRRFPVQRLARPHILTSTLNFRNRN